MGQISAESTVIIADKRRKATLDLVQKELTVIEVPDDYMEANKLLISGYNKNAQGYEFDRDFYSGAGGETAGIKARELFTEGNTEINQAVSMINQKK